MVFKNGGSIYGNFIRKIKLYLFLGLKMGALHQRGGKTLRTLHIAWRLPATIGVGLRAASNG